MSAAPILLVGAGRMGGALLKGWVASGLGPVVVVEPMPSRELKAFAKKHHIAIFADVRVVDSLRARAAVVALKPQVLKTSAAALAPIARSGTLMLSIAAGTGTRTLRGAWGAKAKIVRAMPNTPGAIGRGITALFAAKGLGPKDKALAQSLLAALGETVWVKTECEIDAVTAVSGSGPAYVFLLAEALAAAGRAEGLAPPLADALARATVAGAGALLDADPAAPGDLRRAVTSPGGTTEAALKVLMAKSGLEPLMRRAVSAAHRRAKALGS